MKKDLFWAEFNLCFTQKIQMEKDSEFEQDVNTAPKLPLKS